MRQRVGRNADAVVFHFQHGVAVDAEHAQLNRAFFRRVFDGVVEQVHDHLFEPHAVAFHRQRLAGVAGNGNTFVLGQQLICSAVVWASSVKSKRVHSVCASPASRRESVNNCSTILPKCTTSSSRLAARSRIQNQVGVFCEIFQFAAQNCERRAQVMRGVGDKPF
jgi:hypothetical protein